MVFLQDVETARCRAFMRPVLIWLKAEAEKKNLRIPVEKILSRRKRTRCR